MNRIIYLLLAVSVLTSSFLPSRTEKFEIAGTLAGFSDSTIIYLDGAMASSPNHVDSIFVINNRFRFVGSIKEKVVQVLLRTRDFSDYKFFWLENSSMTFNAKKGAFRDAVITGSKTQDDQTRLDDAIKKSGDEKQQDILFIRSHPNSVISANILSVYASAWGKDTSAMLYRDLSKKLKNTADGKKVLEFITLNKKIEVGDRYVDFTQPNTGGKKVRVSQLEGKVILLEFWGSWCQPCRRGNPELVKVYNEFRDKGFEIFGVAAETDKKAWLEAVKEDGLPWQNVTDLKGDKNRAVLIYGISYFPSNFLIDKNGVIVAKDLRGDNLRNKLDEMLK